MNDELEVNFGENISIVRLVSELYRMAKDMPADEYDKAATRLLTDWAEKRAKAYALELIGEDEDSNFSPMPGVGGFDIEKEARNQLRAELRQRITTEGDKQ